MPNFAQAGQPLDQVFRNFQIALLRAGADWVSYVAGGAGPDGYGDVISPADNRPLERGDVLMLDTGAVREGYFCDFDRNFSIGPASDSARRAHASLIGATQTALDQLRAGMTARDLHQILTSALTAQGATPEVQAAAVASSERPTLRRSSVAGHQCRPPPTHPQMKTIVDEEG